VPVDTVYVVEVEYCGTPDGARGVVMNRRFIKVKTLHREEKETSLKCEPLANPYFVTTNGFDIIRINLDIMQA